MVDGDIANWVRVLNWPILIFFSHLLYLGTEMPTYSIHFCGLLSSWLYEQCGVFKVSLLTTVVMGPSLPLILKI